MIEKFALRVKEKEEELETDHHTNLNKITAAQADEMRLKESFQRKKA